jgi:xylulokinase
LGCEDFVCSQSTGTYLFPTIIDRKKWSVEIARALDFPLDKLPRQVSGVEVVGQLHRRVAQEFGLKAEIPIVAGGGDGQCAAAGCGVLQPGLGLINIGTGAGVQTYLPQPLGDPKMVLNCAAHVDPSAWEMEGHTQASGAVFKWFRDEFGAMEIALQQKSRLDAFDVLIEEAIASPPGADGLLCLPTFNGSTAPVIDQNSRGILLGMNLSHSRSHVIRAFLEGISMEIRWMLDAIEATGASIHEIRLAGGGARNKSWNQIHANILGRPVRTLEITDAALVGAGMCAAVGVGAYANLQAAAEKFVKLKEIVEPQPEYEPIYQALYETYQRTFILLSENRLFERLKAHIG